jgi:ElaB/YqjD/DUF883 family membrane-anchored ribosome-binding protein
VQLNDYHWAALCCEKIQIQEHNMPQTPQYSGERTTSELKDKASDQVGNFVEKATDMAQSAARQVEDFAGKAAEQGREAGERIQEVAGNVKGAVDKSIKDQPMVTLAVAAVVGFVLGALWKS